MSAMAYDTAAWERLGRAVVARRVELGFHTQVSFADLIGLTPRILGDLENGKRLSYGKSTIARVERGLKWEPGTADAILAGRTLAPDVRRDLERLFRALPPDEAYEIPDPIAALLDEYRQAAPTDRAAILDQVRRISEWARYRRER
jgi:hypothetical protein